MALCRDELLSTTMNIFKALLGTRNDREIKRMRKTVAKINALEAAMQDLNDEQLQLKTDELKQRFEAGIEAKGI